MFILSGKFWEFSVELRRKFKTINSNETEVILFPVLDIRYNSCICTDSYYKNGKLREVELRYKIWLFFIGFAFLNFKIQLCITSYPTSKWYCKHPDDDKEKYYILVKN